MEFGSPLLDERLNPVALKYLFEELNVVIRFGGLL